MSSKGKEVRVDSASGSSAGLEMFMTCLKERSGHSLPYGPEDAGLVADALIGLCLDNPRGRYRRHEVAELLFVHDLLHEPVSNGETAPRTEAANPIFKADVKQTPYAPMLPRPDVALRDTAERCGTLLHYIAQDLNSEQIADVQQNKPELGDVVWSIAHTLQEIDAARFYAGDSDNLDIKLEDLLHVFGLRRYPHDNNLRREKAIAAGAARGYVKIIAEQRSIGLFGRPSSLLFSPQSLENTLSTALTIYRGRLTKTERSEVSPEQQYAGLLADCDALLLEVFARELTEHHKQIESSSEAVAS